MGGDKRSLCGHTAGDKGDGLDADYFRTLFDYQYWARDRLLTAANGMSAEEFGAPNGFSYDGLRSLFAHTLAAEVAWLNRMPIGAGRSVEPPSEDDMVSVDSLVAKWVEVESAQRSFLGALKDEDLSRQMEYRMRDGTPAHATVWELLTIVYTHTVQHRSEAAEALTLVGRSPGNLDYIIYMRERNA